MTRILAAVFLFAISPAALAASGLCVELSLAEMALGSDAGYEISMHPRHMAQIEATLGPEISGYGEQERKFNQLVRDVRQEVLNSQKVSDAASDALASIRRAKIYARCP
jgi:hypothetical protein